MLPIVIAHVYSIIRTRQRDGLTGTAHRAMMGCDGTASRRARRDASVAEPVVVKQVAEYPQMSEQKIRDVAGKGELLGVKIRRRWRLDAGDADARLKGSAGSAGNDDRQRRATAR